MDDPLTLLITALGLAIAIEGIVYALFPEGMKRMIAQVLEQPTQNIRWAGLFAATLGVVVLWVVLG